MASLGSAEGSGGGVVIYNPPFYMHTKQYISTRSTSCIMQAFHGIALSHGITRLYTRNQAPSNTSST